MAPERRRFLLVHALAAAGFAVLAIAWSYPLAFRLGTHLPGEWLGDNVLAFWNFWWMRTALQDGASFFRTPYLFAPAGVDLTLHSHTALPALLGATVFGSWPAIAAFNLTTIVALALNGFAAYLLAWRTVRQLGPAIIAGIVFGTSPYIAAHLNGHMNLVHAWPLPLFALAFLDAVRGRPRAPLLAGLLFGLTLYVDYYYAVYELVFAGAATLVASFEVRRITPPERGAPSWIPLALYAAAAFDLAVIAALALTGGFEWQVGPVGLSVRGFFNPLQVLWLLAALIACAHLRRRFAVRRREAEQPSIRVRSLAAMGLVACAVAAPLAGHAVALAWRGQYVSQHYSWRHAPVGIDLLTLVIGNPFNGAWGEPVRRLYSAAGIDLVESGAWLGLVPVAMALAALARAGWSSVRTWAWIGGGFFAWSLGSHVHAAGINTALLAPAVLLRYVPIVSNARMPGRAIVMTYLAIAMLAAIGLASARLRRGRVVMAVLGVLAAADFLAAPFPTLRIDPPAIYQTVRDRPERGALAELPVGLADGFGRLTPLDPAMLVNQSVHGRPVVGGFVARLLPETLRAYRQDPLLAAWLRLSGMRGLEQAPLPDRDQARAMLRRDGIALVMLHRRQASADLRRYVESTLPLSLVADDGERVLYTVR